VPEVTLRLGVVDALNEQRYLLIDRGDLAQALDVGRGGEEGAHFGPDGVVDGDGHVVDCGGEVLWDVTANGVGDRYGLQREDMGEGQFGNLGEVEAVLAEDLFVCNVSSRRGEMEW